MDVRSEQAELSPFPTRLPEGLKKDAQKKCIDLGVPLNAVIIDLLRNWTYDKREESKREPQKKGK